MPSLPSGRRMASSRRVSQLLRYATLVEMRSMFTGPVSRYWPSGSVTGVLLTSLNPAAVAAGADLPDAVTIGGTTLSRSDLVGAATSVAERLGGASLGGVLAT